MSPRLPKVIWKKLGREQAWGMADSDTNTIWVDTRLGAKRQTEVLLHEGLHIAFPEMTEADVDRAGKLLSRLMWSQNYRRVLMDKNNKPPRIS